MRVGQKSFIVFVFKVISSAVGFLATIYFARELGAEVYGFYVLVLSLLAWLEFGSRIGITPAVKKRISEDSEPGSYLSAGLVMITGTTTVAAIMVLLFQVQVNRYVGRDVAEFIIIMLVVVMAYKFVGTVLTGQRDVHISQLISTLKVSARSILQVGLVVFGFGLVGMLVGYILGGIITVTVGIIFVKIRPTMPTIDHARSLYEFARFAWLGQLESRTYNDMDIVILGFFVSPALVGAYGIAWSLSKFLTVFGAAVRSTLFPEISRLSEQGDNKQVAQFITDSLTFGGLILIPGLVGGTLLADRLLLIYGPEFTVATSVLGLLIGAVLAHGYQKQLINGLNAIDRPDIAFRINSVVIVLNIVLNVFLIQILGIVGAAIATALSVALGAILSFGALRRQVQFDFPVYAIGKQISAALIMGLAVYAVRVVLETTMLITNNTVIVLLLVFFGAGVYFVVLFFISKRFRSVVTENLSGMIDGAN